MAYISFARKYRPKDFNTVIGQKHVVNTLKNALKLNRVSHAYIFAGSRGIGKTTISRILTKALNCEKGITENPCNQCENCLEIDKGSFPDMYEIDAASNRGIDDIRNIKDGINYAPIKGRYKVYIIDEAHMLTREAFNALLKTLEEPPPHSVFILATTELHKIPDTIRSRCQVFMFKPPSKEDIKSYLKYILQQENIDYEEEALDLIATYSEGGVRDAASILDQAVTYGGGKVDLASTQELLGIIPKTLIENFLKFLKEKDLKNLVLLIEKLDKEGYDLNIFWKQILENIHTILTNIAIDEKSEIFDESDIKDLIYIQNIFNKAFFEAKNYFEPKHIYTLAILKLKYIKNLKSIEEILKSGVQVSSQPKQQPERQEEKPQEEKGFDIQSAILKIGKEAGGIVSAALKKGKIEEREDSFVIFLEETVYPLVDQKLEIVQKYFPKPVKLEKVSKKDMPAKKAKKRDETVDKVLDLFQGKIMTYREQGG